MGRLSRSLFRVVGFFLFFCFFLSCASFATPSSKTELGEILQKIESRHYRWIAIRASVVLFFATSGNSRAMCGGELLYQRLDERMFLTCVDFQQNLVFVFRTLDRRFDLYLPAQNTIYYGSIFDMENSPDIESHLKPRDLYRALKPMAVDPRHTEIERNNAVVTSLDVYTKKRDKEYLSRKLYLTPEGDVRGELYFNTEGRPATEIQRYDFQKIPAQASFSRFVIFPKKITILSPETKKGSAIFFAKVQPMDSIDSLEFLLRVPEGTKEVFLEEKDPRFAMRRLMTSEKSMLTKKTAAPRRQEQTPLKTPETSPPKKAPAKKRNVSEDADIMVEEQPFNNNETPATSSNPVATFSQNENPNISLDPSVPPSTDMDLPPEPEGPIVKYPKPSPEEKTPGLEKKN